MSMQEILLLLRPIVLILGVAPLVARAWLIKKGFKERNINIYTWIMFCVYLVLLAFQLYLNPNSVQGFEKILVSPKGLLILGAWIIGLVAMRALGFTKPLYTWVYLLVYPLLLLVFKMIKPPLAFFMMMAMMIFGGIGFALANRNNKKK